MCVHGARLYQFYVATKIFSSIWFRRGTVSNWVFTWSELMRITMRQFSKGKVLGRLFSTDYICSQLGYQSDDSFSFIFVGVEIYRTPR